jgi:hypothetical protein
MLVLAACVVKEKDPKVTFMVQGDSGWGVYRTVAVKDGSVALPDDPAQAYFTFRGWYENENFSSGSEFSNRDIKKSKTVYARLIADSLNVYLDDVSQGELRLVDIINGSYAPTRDGLVLDAWYTDAACQVKYVSGDDATELYGRFMAEVMFDNGYEVVWTTLVKPNEDIQKPDGTDVALWYMDPEDIYFQTSDGVKIDFEEGFSIGTSTTVTVRWHNFLNYRENTVTGNLLVSQMDVSGERYYTTNTVPVISIMSEIIYNGVPRKVDSLNHFGGSVQARVVLIDEGIKSITDSFGSGAVEKLVLPSTLKILINAFNGVNAYNKVASVTLPEGLEVLINSFHGADKTSPLGFDIEVPSTVVNIAQAPSNLKFSNNGRFYKDADNRIYKHDERGAILVSDYNIVNGVLDIPEEAIGIQVGAFIGLSIEFLILPESWSFISYNANKADYGYAFGYIVNSALVNVLYNGQYEANPSATGSGMYPMAYSIFSDLHNTRVYIKQSSYPSGLSPYALVGTVSAAIQPYTHSSLVSNVAFIGEAEIGTGVDVYVNYTNRNTEVSATGTYGLTSGGKFTQDELIAVIGIGVYGADAAIVSVKQFGENYDYNATVYSNLYLEVVWEYLSTGFTYSDNGNGTVTVTGVDIATAIYLPAYNSYLVNIPETISGKTIVEIAASAFENNLFISHVSIAATVKKIGAKAFKGTSNLIAVYITPGGLEVIGESAFEDSGFTSIALPLANLKEVAPYAFKSRTLALFTAATGEESRSLYTRESRTTVHNTDIEEGMFFIFSGNATLPISGFELIRYKSTSVEYQNATSSSTVQTAVTVFDVQLIAVCGGALWPQGMPTSVRIFSIGYSGRRSSVAGTTDSVVRYEVMTGSVYFLTNANSIIIGIVSKIHANAFTDIGIKYLTPPYETIPKNPSPYPVYYYRASNATMSDNWIDSADLIAMSSDIFDDGWWEGIIPTDELYEKVEAFMARIYVYAYYLV